MRIENEADAKGLVRKYINGTRSRHGKIASIMMDQKAEGPDEKGMWTIEGSYVTEEGGKEQFTASVTSRGEVLLTIAPKPEEAIGKHSSKFTKRRSGPHSLKETTPRHIPKPLKNTEKYPATRKISHCRLFVLGVSSSECLIEWVVL